MLNFRTNVQSQQTEETVNEPGANRPEYTTIQRQRPQRTENVAVVDEAEPTDGRRNNLNYVTIERARPTSSSNSQASAIGFETTAQPELEYVTIRRARPKTTSDPSNNALDPESSTQSGPEYVTLRRARPKTTSTTQSSNLDIFSEIFAQNEPTTTVAPPRIRVPTTPKRFQAATRGPDTIRTSIRNRQRVRGSLKNTKNEDKSQISTTSSRPSITRPPSNRQQPNNLGRRNNQSQRRRKPIKDNTTTEKSQFNIIDEILGKKSNSENVVTTTPRYFEV